MVKVFLYFILIILINNSFICLGQNDSCMVVIPAANICPQTLHANIVGYDTLVSQTDGSEFIKTSNGRIISVAGWDGVGLSHNRLRYSDDSGVTWHAASNAQFSGRHTFSILEDDGYFYLIGGDYDNTPNERAEIWRTPINDGLNWSLHSNNSPFSDLILYQVVVFNGLWYAIGGQTTYPGLSYIPPRIVYISSDKGLNWDTLNQNVMPSIGLTWGNTAVFLGKVWIVGGGILGDANGLSNKVYSTSDFLSWDIETEILFPRGVIFNRVFSAENYLWSHGGYEYTAGNTSNTYASLDGEIWVDVTSSNTTPNHAAAVIPTLNGWISNNSFSYNYGSGVGGIVEYSISSYQKCSVKNLFSNLTGDSLFSNPLNWSHGLPNEDHFITFQSGSICNIDIGNVTVSKINIESDAILNSNNSLNVVGGDFYAIRNNGILNLNNGAVNINQILGDGILNYGSINIYDNSSFNFNEINCTGLINFGEFSYIDSLINFNFNMNKIGKIGINNYGVMSIKGNFTLTDIGGNGMLNQGSFTNYSNISVECIPTLDSKHLINQGSFFNNGIMYMNSKLGLHILNSGIFENTGVIQSYGNLNIDGILINKVNSLFINN